MGKYIKSYYGISFAGIDSGWYSQTTDEPYASERAKIDKVWSEKCDKILNKYLFKSGTYFTAFNDDIISEIDKSLGTNLLEETRYYDYYIQNRAYEIKKLRNLWKQSYQEELGKKYECQLCNSETKLLECHPDLIRQYGIPPKYCRTCSYVASRYESLGDDVNKQLPFLMQNLSQKRKCDICDYKYSLEQEVFTYDSFGGKFIDCLYPNLFAKICPKCFKKAFKDYKRGSSEAHLSRLYELFLLIGKVPTQDFNSLFYLFKDRESIIQLFQVLQKVRPPDGYTEEFGSYFAALVKSGILPEGSRRLVIGTMVLAEDGHLCLSLVEKEIDDFLYKRGIKHQKEVFYPNSTLRADWEIFGRERRIFIEYFGLMNNPDYADKAKQKMKIAEKHKIEFIGIYPNDNWETILESFGKNLSLKKNIPK